MEFLNKNAMVILTVVTFFLSVLISYWVDQRESRAGAPVTLTNVISHPIETPVPGFPAGIPVTPVSPGTPMGTISVPTPAPTLVASVP